jgi:hypothetical protein
VSRSIGPALPPAALEVLRPAQPAEQLGKIIEVLTVDERGFPHVALLSPGEIQACDPSSFRLALYTEGTTLRNIHARSRFALAIVEPGLCCYVKAIGAVTDVRVSEGPTQPFAATRVEARVDDVLIDSESGAFIAAGARYRRAIPTDVELAEWHRVWHELGCA